MLKESDEAIRPKVGSEVYVKATHRVGCVVVDDESDLPFRVQFDDGVEPASDWFRECDLCVCGLPVPAAEVEAALAPTPPPVVSSQDHGADSCHDVALAASLAPAACESRGSHDADVEACETCTGSAAVGGEVDSPRRPSNEADTVAEGSHSGEASLPSFLRNGLEDRASFLPETTAKGDLEALRARANEEARNARAAQKVIASMQEKLAKRDEEHSKALFEACQERDVALQELEDLREELAAAQAYREKVTRETEVLCGRHVQDVEALHAKLDEKNRVIERMARSAETRSAAMAEETAALREQVESLSKSSRAAEVELRDMRQNRLVEDAHFSCQVAATNDLEIGKGDITLEDVGLDRCNCLVGLDERMRQVTVLMVKRADVRIAVFAIWLLCHFVYTGHTISRQILWKEQLAN